MDVAGIPVELQALPRWVCWFWGTPRADGTRPKIPVSPQTRRGASHSRPADWGTWTQALALYRSGRYEGLQLALGDGLTCADLDACIAADGTIRPFAQDVIRDLDSYTAYSWSRTGIHVFVWGRKPGPRCRYAANGDELELYDRQRFIAVTGVALPGSPVRVAERPDALSRLYACLWPARVSPARTACPTGQWSDTDLLRVAGYSATFRALWAGDLGRYAGNESRADYAFCCSLAGLTRDPSQIERLWRNSGLARLPGRTQKWASRRSAGTYGTWTIHAALQAVSPRFEAYIYDVGSA